MLAWKRRTRLRHEQDSAPTHIRLSHILASLILGSQLAFALPAVAAPPLITDDAGTVDVGKVEIELNNSYARDSENENGFRLRRELFDSELKITTGLYKNLGISLIAPYTFSERARENGVLSDDANGFGDMTLELKYCFLELSGINFTIKPTVLIPTGKYSAGLSGGRWQFGGSLIATREFQDGKYALHANLGYEHHDYRTDEMKEDNRRDLWSGSLAAEVRLLKELIAVVDFGLATSKDKSSDELSAYALSGLRYEVNEHLDLDVGVKVGLTRPEDDLAILYGLVLKF
ncbi:MAG: transporter [Desulfuromonadales bacterium]|nr:transporter [Desulfuromonadales bacterium]